MKTALAFPVTDVLRDAVPAEFATDPHVDTWRIGVVAEDGVVTLTGSVESLGMSVATERAAKRVAGVRSIANDLCLPAPADRTDTDIAREALHRLRNNVAIPESVQAVVHDGFITLDGSVSWMHQRAAAESAVRYLRGVKGVSNDIVLTHP